MSTLFVVATPIGNLDEMTPRAVRTLREVTLIAAEDTRHSAYLLRHFGVETPMLSYHAFNEKARVERLLDALAHGDVALISDAGTPGISDPGRVLVEAAHVAGYKVSPISGPSAMAAAISVSGLVDGPFTFLGFLPRDSNDRRVLLSTTTTNGFPIVLFESPNRLVATLVELHALLGDQPAVVAREISKIHEDIRSGTLGSLAEHYRSGGVLGEVVVIVGSRQRVTAHEDPEALVQRLLDLGMKPSQAAKEGAALSGLPRADLYEIAIRLSKG
jgi:16S rRNA (cytidine1402-2'-O)-methyltransferase